MNDQELDLRIRDALLDAAAEEFAGELRSEDVLPVSETYRQNMRMLLPKAHRKQRRWQVCTWAAVLILLFGVVLSASPSVRAAVKNWFAAISDNGNLAYSFAGEGADDLPRYGWPDLPEDSIRSDEMIHLGMSREIVCWDAENQAEMTLTYGSMREEIALTLNTSELESTAVEVNGCPGTLLKRQDGENGSWLFWMDDGAGIRFILEGAVPGEILLERAEQIVNLDA